MRLSIHPARRRPAFSLIELMVAMALTLFVMVVLTQAFVTSLETFSALKSIGELQANLRTVSSLLQADLAADHFEGKRRLSSPDLLANPTNPPGPSQGFFYIYQGSASVNAVPPPPVPQPYELEGTEALVNPPLGLSSWRAGNHMLYFTVRLRGNRPENFMTAPLPVGSPLLNAANSPLLNPATAFFNQPADGVYLQPNSPFLSSQWAEVCYFLVQTGTTNEVTNTGDTTGTPVYSLYRAQYLLVVNPSNVSVTPWPTATASDYANVSSFMILNPPNPAALGFNAPDDLASKPANRTLNLATWPPTRATDQAAGMPALPAGAPPRGSTLVVSGVTSFQVQVFSQQLSTDFTDLPAPANFPATYDTASNPPPTFNIQAIKVTIRIWDATSKLSRQITIIQDM